MSSIARSAASRAEELLGHAHRLAPYSGSADAPLGMSLGVAVLQSGSDESLEALMARADKAMYASKKRGKGAFTIAPPTESSPAAEDPRP